MGWGMFIHKSFWCHHTKSTYRISVFEMVQSRKGNLMKEFFGKKIWIILLTIAALIGLMFLASGIKRIKF